MRARLTLLGIVALAFALTLPMQAATIIDFNSHPDDFGNPITDSGFTFNFSASGWGVFGPASGACCNVNYNGTTSLFADGDRNGQNANVVMTASDGSAFSVSSLDASGYWIGAAGRIEVTGNFLAGGQISTILSVDSTWKTYALAGFDNLVSLTIRDTQSGGFLDAPGFGIDNINLGGGGGVPEPGTLVMLGSGALGFAGLLRRKLNV